MAAPSAVRTASVAGLDLTAHSSAVRRADRIVAGLMSRLMEPVLAQNRVLTLPNLLSVVRLALIPVFVYLMLVTHTHSWAVAILMFSGFSDWADGKIARVLNQSSRLGVLLDPAVDRLYMITVPIVFALGGIAPWWFVHHAAGPRCGCWPATLPLLWSRGLSALPVSYVGKAATFALMSGFPLVLLGSSDALWSRIVGACGWAFLLWGLYMYLWAFVLYMVQMVLVMRRMPKVDAPPAAGRPKQVNMADPDRLLGGYDPNAGYSAHVAARPKHLPVPSLLRALLSEHLDPGYAAAAAEAGTPCRTGSTRGRPRPGLRLDLAGAGGDAGRRRVCRRGRAGPLGCSRRAHRTAAAGHQRAVRRSPPPPNWPSSAARCRRRSTRCSGSRWPTTRRGSGC